MRQWILCGAVALALAACGKREDPAPTQGAEAPAPHASFGLDLSAVDAAVKPGSDFYAHANGLWLKDAVVPDDHSSYGAYAVLADRVETQLRETLEKAASAPAGGAARKAADYYATLLDAAAIEAKGLQPLAPDIAAFRAIANQDGLMAAFGRDDFGAGPFAVEIDIDARNPERRAAYLTQSGLGLGAREHYLDERYADLRERYRAYIEEMFKLAGESAAPARADAVLGLEQKIAEAHWEPAKRRNRDLTYNPISRDSLATFAPASWDAYFAASGLPADSPVVLREDDAIQKLAGLVATEPLDAWRDYLIFHLLDSNADILPQKFDEARRAFAANARSEERWRRALALVDLDLGGALGEAYAAQRYSPETRKSAEALAGALRAATAEKLDAALWMSAAAKAAAKDKLAALQIKLGAPSRGRAYAGLEIVKGDAVGNRKRARAFERANQIRRLNVAVDRADWTATPQTADVWYDPKMNEVVIPVAMLQAPYFDPRADDAVNFGAIGALIGHELTHAFDAHGRKTDGAGVLLDWWTGEDAAGFAKRAGKLTDQYAAFLSQAGPAADARAASGEAMADLGGVSLAHRAYHLSLKGGAAPTLDGLSGDQRFFLSWAQIWRRKLREDQEVSDPASDALPQAAFRVNGTLRNLDAWHAAFRVGESDALYLPPSERVTVW